MIARDGSASDWFPRGMTQGSPNIRLFGRHTAGAFSSYFLFDYYSNFSWRFASGDLLNPDGSTNLGTGVQPDEEIVPLQSDLLAGVDTVYARALDWVRTCTTCRQ
jgi:C-terminal processing protease CtpA/Prc